MRPVLKWLLGLDKELEKQTDRNLRRAANYKGTAWRILLGLFVWSALLIGICAGVWAAEMTEGRAAIEDKHLLNSIGEWLKLGSGLIYLGIGFAAAGFVAYFVIKWGWKRVSESWDEALLILEKAKRRLEWEKANHAAQMQLAQWEAQQKALAAQRPMMGDGDAPPPMWQNQQALPPMALGPEPPAVTTAEVLIFLGSIVARSSLILGIFAVGVTLALYM